MEGVHRSDESRGQPDEGGRLAACRGTGRRSTGSVGPPPPVPLPPCRYRALPATVSLHHCWVLEEAVAGWRWLLFTPASQQRQAVISTQRQPQRPHNAADQGAS